MLLCVGTLWIAPVRGKEGFLEREREREGSEWDGGLWSPCFAFFLSSARNFPSCRLVRRKPRDVGKNGRLKRNLRYFNESFTTYFKLNN
jgi:hypothetical protein